MICVVATAQTNPTAGRTSIRGSVKDSQNHMPLYRVIVDVESQSGGNAGQVITDSTGKFDVEGLDPDAYLVRIRFPGYDEALERVDLTVASSNYLDIELKRKSGDATRPVAPEGPNASLDARLASVPGKARAEFDRGRDCLSKGKVEETQSCIEHLNKAIKIYPKFADAYVMVATAYLAQNNAGEAKSTLQHAIDIDPKLPQAWVTLGMLQNREKDYIAAEKSLTECLKFDDNSPQAHYELARTYWATGRLQDAEAHAQRAAALQPTMAPVHVLLGNIALRKQDGPGAVKEFQEYLKLDPKGPMAQGAQTMVDKIQGATATKQ